MDSRSEHHRVVAMLLTTSRRRAEGGVDEHQPAEVGRRSSTQRRVCDGAIEAMHEHGSASIETADQQEDQRSAKGAKRRPCRGEPAARPGPGDHRVTASGSASVSHSTATSATIAASRCRAREARPWAQEDDEERHRPERQPYRPAAAFRRSRPASRLRRAERLVQRPHQHPLRARQGPPARQEQPVFAPLHALRAAGRGHLHVACRPPNAAAATAAAHAPVRRSVGPTPRSQIGSGRRLARRSLRTHVRARETTNAVRAPVPTVQRRP